MYKIRQHRKFMLVFENTPANSKVHGSAYHWIRPFNFFAKVKHETPEF